MTIQSLYKATCVCYGREPEPELAKAWIATLSAFGISEVERALEKHKSDHSMDNLGRTKGSYMPYPSDIAHLIHQFRTQSSIAEKFAPCGKCESGWIRKFHGITVGSNPIDEKVGAVVPCECRTNWVRSRSAN